MHLGHAAGRVAGDLPQESTQGLVRECERGQSQRRPRGDLQSQAAAALAARHAGVRLFAGLSLPRPARPAHPIGTGPYRFVEMKQNETIKLVKNPDYWKKGLPYLDGIEFAIIPNRSTAILAFVTGKVDMTFPTEVTVALQKDIKAQAPNAVCDLQPTNVNTNLIINRDAPPFDNPSLRSAMAMALDRKAFVDILFQGQADIGGALLPPPAGVWGLPPDILKTMPGYGPDVQKNRAEARK